eukprot:CAMPEP_0194045278 /NCGR_PEP_ID=MMETSP0009_2-20130614/16646_1 /TAXON_ID=210454 /ORGANISM="Grammatophora oceanica, Strain CCMP 410" /LENGTH=30 /DNA_ID= /DNA_START= /DNA_END= /DNA_ORIENTATION=
MGQEAREVETRIGLRLQEELREAKGAYDLL